jgi:hypothetical protein
VELLHPGGHGVKQAQWHRRDESSRVEPFILGAREKGGQSAKGVVDSTGKIGPPRNVRVNDIN